MTLQREHIPSFLSVLLGKRVRWSPFSRARGLFDGAPNTLDVFGTPAAEQRALNLLAWKRRQELKVAAGGPVLLVFHEEKLPHAQLSNARMEGTVFVDGIPLEDAPVRLIEPVLAWEGMLC